MSFRTPLSSSPEQGLPMPRSSAELTPAWTTAVLRSRHLITTSRVTNVVTKPIGNGMLGTNLRLELEYDSIEPAAPRTLVAKLAATRPESRATGAQMGLYLRETRFYQEIAPTAAVGLPETLFADISDDAQDYCLLFENLAPARCGDQIEGCEVADAGVAMDAAADLHAPLWGTNLAARYPWLDRAVPISLYTTAYRQCALAIRSRYETLVGAETLAIVDAFSSRIERYFVLQNGPFTVTHQDFRLDNMLFQAQGGRIPVAVLDWQTVLAGPGTTDVAYFIGAGLLADARRRHEEALVRRYHAALEERGVRGYTWDRCWADYRLFAAQGLITAVIAAVITSPTERGDQMLSAMLTRHAQHMLDHDNLSLID